MKKLNFLRRSYRFSYDQNFLMQFNVDGFIQVPYTNENFEVHEEFK